MNLRAAPGSVEMLYKDTVSYFKPIGPNKTLLIFVIYFDLQLSFMPKWLMDWFIRSVTGVALGYLQNSSSSLPENFMERYRQRDEFYQVMRDKLAVMIQKEDEYRETG